MAKRKNEKTIFNVIFTVIYLLAKYLLLQQLIIRDLELYKIDAAV